MCGIVWAYTGPLTGAEEAFRPIRAFKKPAVDVAAQEKYGVDYRNY